MHGISRQACSGSHAGLVSASLVVLKSLCHPTLPHPKWRFDIGRWGRQALEMMSGPAAKVPAVRAYALRSLHACNPQQVAPLS